MLFEAPCSLPLASFLSSLPPQQAREAIEQYRERMYDPIYHRRWPKMPEELEDERGAGPRVRRTVIEDSDDDEPLHESLPVSEKQGPYVSLFLFAFALPTMAIVTQCTRTM